jgi:hypothetical protein
MPRGMQRGMQQRGAAQQRRPNRPAGGTAPPQRAAARPQAPQAAAAAPPAAAPARTPALAAAARPAMSQAMGAQPGGLAAPRPLQPWQQAGLGRAVAQGREAGFLANHPGVQQHMNRMAAQQAAGGGLQPSTLQQVAGGQAGLMGGLTGDAAAQQSQLQAMAAKGAANPAAAGEQIPLPPGTVPL